MKSAKKLHLKKETLVELTSSDLSNVLGGDGPTHRGCTLPVNQCALSLNPCEYSTPANCGTIITIEINTTG